MAIENLTPKLELVVGQMTSPGLKPANEDAVGIRIPTGNLLATKGAVAVIADGVSASEGGKEASETAVTSFLSDYFSTPDSWAVKTSGVKVLTALNRWLHRQGHQFLHAEKGYITTFSALIIKSCNAYIFHVGDSRIYRLRNSELEQLTTDHTNRVGEHQRYLGRALGIDTRLDVDFRRLDLQAGDRFLLTTDGVHNWLKARELLSLMEGNSTDSQRNEQLCRRIIDAALAAGSDDNLSIQIIEVAELGQAEAGDALIQLGAKPFPPPLAPGHSLDGWKVLKIINESARSQVYLVEHQDQDIRAVMKTPSINYEEDPAYIERFILEEWIGTRVQNPHVVKIVRPMGNRQFLYYLTEYVPGPTLAQLLRERTQLSVVDSCNIITQVASGLRAFHRRDTLHQDIKPDNIIYSENGVKIIDFGSTYIAGISEISSSIRQERIQGTLDYCAPEYKLDGPISPRSDQFSLAILLYELLTGKHPFGPAYSRATTKKDFLKLQYRPAFELNPLVPVWLDGAIAKAMSIQPEERYDALSEFIHDLTHPNPEFGRKRNGALLENHPEIFWKRVALALLFSNLVLLVLLAR